MLLEKHNIYIPSFEELYRAHIKAFADRIEKYATEAQLSKRVMDWQRRLTPTLALEEERSSFNIHKYGEKILKSVKEEDPGDKVHFGLVSQEAQSFKVSQYFLATLMLDNNRNVEFIQEDGFEVLWTC